MGYNSFLENACWLFKLNYLIISRKHLPDVWFGTVDFSLIRIIIDICWYIYLYKDWEQIEEIINLSYETENVFKNYAKNGYTVMWPMKI